MESQYLRSLILGGMLISIFGSDSIPRCQAWKIDIVRAGWCPFSATIVFMLMIIRYRNLKQMWRVMHIK